MDELIAFLRARYDEAEAWAQAELGDLPHEYVGDVTPAQAAALWTLAGIEGKRKIVDMAEAQPGYHLADGTADERDEDERHCDEALQVMMVEVLHHLAEEFSAHPDYKAKDWSELRG